VWDETFGDGPAGVPGIPGADARPLAGPVPPEIAHEIKESLGIGVPRTRYRPGGLRPDTSGLAEGLGLK